MKRVPLVVGECNLCGLCCFNPATGTRCSQLEVTGKPGEPYATRCLVYDQRYDGMPILMVDRDGKPTSENRVCTKDSIEEDLSIIASGIGRGCTLTFNPDITTVFIQGEEKK